MYDNYDDDDFMRDDKDMYDNDNRYDDFDDDMYFTPPCYGNCPMMQMNRQNPPFGPGGPGGFGPGGPGGPGPGGPGGFGPGGPGGFGPGQGPGQSGPPSTPPPAMTPTKATTFGPGGPSVFAVDPGAIRPCRFRFVYIWLDNGRSFWAWLTFVGRRSAAGWRWNGFRWVYFGIDLDRIESFQCF